MISDNAKNGWVGSRIIVDYIGEGKSEAERFSGVVEQVRFIKKTSDYLYTVKLDDGQYRSLYLDNSAKCELVEFNGQTN